MRTYSLLLLFGAQAMTAQTTSVLFIGNSYTTQNDLPNTFRQLALSLGDTVEVAVSAPGGFTFTQHWEHTPTQEAIASRAWDFVVLQEQSQVPALHPGHTALANMYGSARLLVERIKQNHECTMPVFYMTWGRENGDQLNCPTWPPVCTFAGMQDLLRERYLEMAFFNHGCAAPVGSVWKEVRETHPDIDLYENDGSHPTVMGTYLAASVLYSTLFHQGSTGAAYTAGLEPTTAGILQGLSTAIVLDSAATWRLDTSPGLSAAIFWTEIIPPNTRIFHAPGQGQHLWICSDGQTSTSADPEFPMVPGDYTMTHIYTDLCGITDTASWAFMAWHEGGIGIDEPTDHTVRVIGPEPGCIEVRGGTGSEVFVLADVQGRLVHVAELAHDRMRFPCRPGAYTWSIRGSAEGHRNGKLVVH